LSSHISDKLNVILWLASNPRIDQELERLKGNFNIVRLDHSVSQEDYPRENVVGIVTNTAPTFFYSIEFFSTFKNLQFVASPSTGVTHFCANDLQEKGVLVLTIKDRPILGEISSSSEHAVFLVLATIRKARMAFEMALDGTWRQKEQVLRTSQLRKKTIGVVGLGRIGGCVAKVFNALGMTVYYYDPYVKTDSYEQVYNIKHLFEKCSIVIISCTLTEETRYLIDKKCLDLANGTYLVNVARGEIVNEEHVLVAIDGENLAGYTTDVLSDEVAEIKNSGILKAAKANRNIIVTPHCAGLSYDSEFLAAKDIIDQILER
jgi:D-3-phosphoglycerate dehydrogenase / 2-oxoglutarate reductase